MEDYILHLFLYSVVFVGAVVFAWIETKHELKKEGKI